MQSLVFQSTVNHSEERISRMLQAVRPKYKKKSNVKNKETNSIVKAVTQKRWLHQQYPDQESNDSFSQSR